MTIPRSVKLIALPDVRQRKGFTCGPTVMIAVGRYFGAPRCTQAQLARVMKITATGSDPDHMRTAAEHFGLQWEEHFSGMTAKQLKAALDRGRPVVMMLQAWGDADDCPGYPDSYCSGHWVAAIGYDDDRWYFEDPWLRGARGYLTREELDRRWHDIDRHNQQIKRYGLVLWKDALPKKLQATRLVEPIP